MIEKKNRDKLVFNEIKNEISYIESILSDRYLIDFYEKYINLIKNKKSETFFNYWGINFTDDGVNSLKFYLHIFDELDKNDIVNFIPSTKEFEEFISLKKSNSFKDKMNVGIALTIKFKMNTNKPTFGFYFLLNDIKASIDKIGFAKNLPQHFKEDCIAIGINFEYDNDKTTFKKYYYFDKREIMDFFEKKFNLKNHGGDYIIEYSESNDFEKLNLYRLSNEIDEENLYQFSSKEKRIIQYLKEKFNVRTPEYGSYLNENIKSIYFFNPKTNELNVDSLKSILHHETL